MKSILVLLVVIAVAVAKPSGILAPHIHTLGYSSPVHETVVSGPGVVHHSISHHNAAVLHHPIHETYIAEAPAVVHHKSVVADIPTAVSHQHSSVVHHHTPAVLHQETIVEPAVRHSYISHEVPAIHHGYIAHEAPAIHHSYIAHEAPAVVAHAAPAVVHHEVSHAVPAAVHHEFTHTGAAVVHHEVAHAAPAVVHHEISHVEPAVVHHKSVIADIPTAVSQQHSTVVHKSAPIHHTVVAEAPVVHHAVVPAVQHSVISEPIGVKQTISHQDSSIVHSAAVHHEIPTFHHAVVADVHHAAPVSSQYHAQDTLGQYSFGYASPLSSKVEVKTLDGVTKGGFNYLDAFGKEQSVQYVSDDVHGFRVAASNLPVGPAPVVDTPEVAAAKAAHLSIHESTKAAVAAVKSADISQHVLQHDVAAVAPVVPSAYSYSFVAQKPVHHVATAVVAQPTAVVHDVPFVGISHDSVAVDAKIGPSGFVHNVGVLPGLTFTATGLPVDTPEVAHAKAAHFAAYRASAHLKDEKPCD
ncbi:hypothetical protein RN001_008204 [Aquatica leii]|uniref:Cuticle protein n=1 Tax=Aquatica leii TaxID=1421715 RepID=A0AAN7PAG3_9COLE|nr:hypothetical protein RN001_008204 [Aquatica leii]